jgi:hypothetical protein
MGEIIPFPRKVERKAPRPSYRRTPLVWNESMRMRERPIEAWEIDSSLSPLTAEGQQVIYTPPRQ